MSNPSVRIRILTLFPDMVRTVVGTSILGRAADAGLLEVEPIDIRSFAGNRYGKVDDTLYGGGTGMLLMCPPVFDAWEQARKELGGKAHTVYLSARGTVFTQEKAIALSREESLILLCGHYEGVDQRVLDEIVDEEVSIGDYVLTGGELPALVVTDALARMIPGVLPNEEAIQEESHMNGTVEGPHFTKPAEWHEKKAPDILLSGHHAKINEYRYLSSLAATMKHRPDLFAKLTLSTDDWKRLERFLQEEEHHADP